MWSAHRSLSTAPPPSGLWQSRPRPRPIPSSPRTISSGRPWTRPAWRPRPSTCSRTAATWLSYRSSTAALRMAPSYTTPSTNPQADMSTHTAVSGPPASGTPRSSTPNLRTSPSCGRPTSCQTSTSARTSSTSTLITAPSSCPRTARPTVSSR